MKRHADLLRHVAVLLCLAPVLGAAAAQAGPQDGTVLLIRHAEKPEEGAGLTPAGEARAKAYVEYFKNFQFGSQAIKLDAIFATEDSKKSSRPRLTVEPLAQALGLPVRATYKDKDYQALANELQAHATGKNVLICWHHGEMPALLRALGADPAALLPGGAWPSETYNWVIVLRYDHEGHLKESQRVVEPF